METLTPSKLFRSFEVIRKHANEREIPGQLVSIFLAIASKGGDVGQEDLIELTGTSRSAVSRNVGWLGPRNKLKRRDGLRWIEVYQDPRPDYWRHKRVRLTALGRQVITEALEA